MNVAHLLTERVQKQPQARALVWTESGLDQSLTFAELEKRCDAQAHGLRTFGFRPGDRVLLMERPGPNFVSLSWALFKLGCVPVLLDPGMGVRPLLRCIEKLRPDGMVGVAKAHLLRSLNPKVFASVRRAVCSDSRWPGASPLWRLSDPLAGSFSPHQQKPDDLAAILFTSGSTGPAKGVEYRHSMLRAQVKALQRMFGMQPGELDMPGFPLFGLFSQALGLTAVLPEMNPSRPAEVEPARLVRTILDWQVNNLQGSPAIWERLGRYCEDFDIALPSLRRIITFGAPIPVSFIQMWQRVAPNCLCIPYGATEALPISWVSGQEVLSDTSSHTLAGGGTCVGAPVEGVSVRILRTSDEAITEWNEDLLLGAGEIGEIVVAGDQVSWAYDQDAEATRQAKIIQGERCWHRMGDLGYFDASGRLWVVGRKSERVQGTSHTYYPFCAEGIANGHPEVRRSALVGVQQKPVLVVELKNSKVARDVAERNRVAREVKERLAEHNLYAEVKEVLFRKDFPVDPRHNVKIDRQALSEWASKQGSKTS
jgi:acyl-CoA synthetase (AMP-forming)/AMP-acid ligase II